jgi:hypothetical protein
MDRTIADAQATAENASGWSIAEQREATADLARERAASASIGTRVAEQEFLRLQDVGAGAMDSYESITTEADAVPAKLVSGELSASDARGLIENLLTRHRTAAAARERFEEGAQTVGAIAADPESWVATIYEKYPRLRPTWRW